MDMLPKDEQDHKRKYDQKVQHRVCTLLRHQVSETSWMTVWPDGFVHLETLLREETKYKEQVGGLRKELKKQKEMAGEFQ